MSLHQKHYAELKASCLSDAIIERYFFSIEGDEAQRYIIEDALGELKGHSAQYATADVRKLMRQSEHLKGGAWGCRANGQLKPDNPRIKWEKDEHGRWKEARRDDGSAARIKYEIIREKPYKGANVSLMEPCGAPISNLILVSEGSKKAGSVASLGYQAIGLPGIEMGLTAKDANGKRFLIPALKSLAEQGATIAIAPDRDEKLSTQINVERAVSVLAAKYEAAGGTVLFLPEWPIEHGKGIDDVQASQGAAYIHKLIGDAIPFKQWRSLKMAASLRSQNPEYYGLTGDRTTVNQRYIEYSLPAPGTVLGISSPMGTGKTTAGSELKDAFFKQHPDGYFDLQGYRNGLGQQTARNWSMDHISELECVGAGQLNNALIQDSPALSYCLDSLNRRAPGIEAALAEERTVCLFLDEGDAVLKHILGGGTLKGRQAEIWELWCSLMSAVIAGGGYIVLAEASLTQLSVNAITDISGGKLELIENTYQPHKGRKIYDYSALSKEGKHSDQLLPKACLHKASDLLEDGPLFLASDSQGFAERADAFFDAAGYSVLRIDGDTKAEQSTIAFLEDPDSYIAQHQPDVTIATTTAESGVSISEGYFENVELCGSHLEDRALAQLGGRVRGNAPIHAFIKRRVKAQGEEPDSFSADGVSKEWMQNSSDAFVAADVAKHFDPELLKTSAEASQGTDAQRLHDLKAVYQARKNISNFSLHYGVMAIFEQMGCDISDAAMQPSAFSDEFKERWENAKQSVRDRRTQKFIESPIDQPLSWAHRINASSSASRDDRIKAEKIILDASYPGLPFDDEEFVGDEVIGNRCQHLKAHSFAWLCRNPKIAKIIDLQSWKAQLEQRFIILPSIRKESAKVKVLAQSALADIAELASYSEDTPLIADVAAWAKGRAKMLGRLFRLQIKEGQSNIAIVNKLLRKIGYVSKSCKRTGSDGERQRLWKAEAMPYQDEVFAALEQKWITELNAENIEVEQPSAPTSTICTKENSYMQIMDAAPNPPLEVVVPSAERDPEGYMRAIELLDQHPEAIPIVA